MLAGNHLDERGGAAAGMPVAVLQPQRLCQAKAALGKKRPQQLVPDLARPLPLAASNRAHASQITSICPGVSTGGGTCGEARTRITGR
jgi:hypothetical protein